MSLIWRGWHCSGASGSSRETVLTFSFNFLQHLLKTKSLLCPKLNITHIFQCSNFSPYRTVCHVFQHLIKTKLLITSFKLHIFKFFSLSHCMSGSERRGEEEDV